MRLTGSIDTLKKRKDFLTVAKEGKKLATHGLILQILPSFSKDNTIQVGFITTKRLGSAVIRNRIRRRLRAIARQLLPEHGIPGCTYVIVGRGATLERSYSQLVNDLRYAMQKTHSWNPLSRSTA